MLSANDGSAYSEAHAKYHPLLKQFVDKGDFYDVFLIDKQGNVVYTDLKEVDFGSNLNQGSLKNTGLAKVFNRVLSSNIPNHVYVSDFEPYAPSYGLPASFMGYRIVNKNNQLEGVLAIQLNGTQFNKLMKKIGAAGETFITGADRFYRTDSIGHQGATNVLKKQLPAVFTDVLTEAKQTYPKVQKIQVNGQSLFAYAKVLNFQGAEWFYVGTQPEADMFVSLYQMQLVSLLTLITVSVGLITLGQYIAKQITTPLLQLTQPMQALAQGNETVEIVGRERVDELGDMAKTVQIFKDNLIQKNQLDRDNQLQAEEMELQRKEMSTQLLSLADQLEETVKLSMEGVYEELSLLEQATKDMTADAEATASGIHNASTASSQLAIAAHEISNQVGNTSNMVNQAHSEGTQANGMMQHLAQATQDIGQVVGLISGITEQTNLL